MENSNQLDELLVKYLISDLTEEEEVFVINWINANEENRQYFESLKNTWRLTSIKQAAETINVNAEWDRFQQAVRPDEGSVVNINANEYQALAYTDADNETPERKPFIYRVLVAAAIAASVVLVIGLGWKLFDSTKQEAAPIVQDGKRPGDSLLVTTKHEVNTSGKPKTLILQDGSQVVLWDQSEISFEQPFAHNRRHIILKGKADFKVAKDQSRPFTVFSGDILTTALGTQFTVTAFENAATITVRLYEGKVVVKSIDSASRKLKKDYFLQPGQELVYDNAKVTARVRSFYREAPVAKEEIKEEAITDDPAVPKKPGTWYMFNNQPLDQVFRQLAEMYDAEIIYSKKDVQKMYFIGDFDKSDSLELILRKIAIPNNLTVTRQDNKYIIKK